MVVIIDDSNGKTKIEINLACPHCDHEALFDVMKDEESFCPDCGGVVELGFLGESFRNAAEQVKDLFRDFDEKRRCRAVFGGGDSGDEMQNEIESLRSRLADQTNLAKLWEDRAKEHYEQVFRLKDEKAKLEGEIKRLRDELRTEQGCSREHFREIVRLREIMRKDPQFFEIKGDLVKGAVRTFLEQAIGNINESIDRIGGKD